MSEIITSGIFGKMLSLKDEQERVQKKTFTKWINCYLTQLIPPVLIKDIYVELSDGLLLLQLLEMLTKRKMNKERPKTMQRIHCIMNVKTALEFMEIEKKIKMVNINPSDIVDGKPSIVLGLIWTLILFFQIEEQEEFLLHALGLENDPSAKVKGMAKKALMAWSNNALSEKYGLNLKDFGESWRDGKAFNALVHNINPDLIDMDDMQNKSNMERLENAFSIAENELGIPRLLDSEDVDVAKPDEKSIMTYVAQFLKSYPEGKKPENIEGDLIAEKVNGMNEFQGPELNDWEKLKEFNEKVDSLWKDSNLKKDYNVFNEMMDKKCIAQDALDNIRKENLFNEKESLQQMELLFKESEEKLRKWQWDLDKSLPGELGSVIAPWLNAAESFIFQPIINYKSNGIEKELPKLIASHKNIFSKKEEIMQKLESYLKNPPIDVSIKQLNDLRKRMESIVNKEPEKMELIAILTLQSKLNDEANKWNKLLDSWTTPISSKEDFHRRMVDYNVSIECGNPMDQFSEHLNNLIQKSSKYFKDNSPLDPNLEEFLKTSLENCETENDILPSKFELCCGNLEHLSSAWKDIEDHELKVQTFLIKIENCLKNSDIEQQKVLSGQLPDIKDLINSLKRSFDEEIKPFCDNDLIEDMNKRINDIDNSIQHITEEVINNIEKEEQEKAFQLQAIQDAKVTELVENGDEIIKEIKDWFHEVENSCKNTSVSSPKQLNDMLENLENLNKKSPKIKDLIKNGYNFAKDLKAHNSPDKAAQLEMVLDNFSKQMNGPLDETFSKNKTDIHEMINLMNGIEKGINYLSKIEEEGNNIQDNLYDDVDSVDSINNINSEKEFLSKRQEIASSIENDKALLNKLKEIAKFSTIEIDIIPLEKKMILKEKNLQELLQKVENFLKATDKCEEACNAASQSLEDIGKVLQRANNIDNNERSQKESLDIINNLEKDFQLAEDKIKIALNQRDKERESLGKVKSDKIDYDIKKIQNDAADLKKMILKSKDNLKNSLQKWNDFNNIKNNVENKLEKLSSELNESHKKRNCNHGGDYQDKLLLLNENKKRLQTLNEHEKEIEEICKLASLINSEVATEATKEMKRAIDQKKKLFETEISQNIKDLEIHKNFQDELNYFKDLVNEGEKLNAEIQQTPETKEGLVKKQDLFKKLKELKSPGNDKLKELKNLYKTLLDVTSPDAKEIISADIDNRLKKFNQIFENLDNSNDSINETLSKLENIDNKCEKLSDNTKTTTSDLNKILQQPKNTVADKKNLDNELTRMSRLIDQQKDEMNALKKESESLGKEARDEMLSKLGEVENELVNANHHINEELSQNKTSLDQQTKLENGLSNLDALLNQFNKNIAALSIPTNSKQATEDNINNVQELNNDLMEIEDLITSSVQNKNEAIPYISKLERSKIESKITNIQDETKKSEDTLKELKNNLEDNFKKWNIFNDNKHKIAEILNKISNELEISHNKRKGIHGGDGADKALLLNDNEKRLCDLKTQEIEIEKMIVLVEWLHSEDPLEESMNLKTLCEDQIENLKKEITLNKRDLEDHHHYEKELDFFKEWIKEAEAIKIEMNDTSNTKDGLLQKQKLLEKLNNLKFQGNNNLLDLRKLQNIVLDQTAFDFKDQINSEYDKELKRFNEVFGNIDNFNNNITETILKLDNIEEKCGEMSKDIEKINADLDQAMQKPRDSISDKIRLNEELVGLCQFIDEQKNEIDVLRKQGDDLNDEAKDEVALELKKLENELSKTEEYIKDLLSKNQESIDKHVKLEDSVKILDSFINKVEDDINKYSVPANNEKDCEDNLKGLQNLEKDLKRTEDIIENVIEKRNNAKSELSKSELDKMDKKINEMQNHAKNLNIKFVDSNKMVEKELNNWNVFNNTRDRVRENLGNFSKELDQSHSIRNGIHGGNLEDKASLLKDNEKRLNNLKEQEYEIQEIINLVKELNSDLPLKEAEELMRICQDNKIDLEKEIAQNHKDLENHQHFQKELNAFQDWVKESETTNKEIQEAPNTKEGLLKKQKLLENLNDLKSSGNNKLKTLKKLQKIVLNETASDNKEEISIEFKKELERFNDVFGNLDNFNDEINGTLTKLEIMEEKYEEYENVIGDMKKDLEKSLNQPRDSILDKEKLEKVWTRMNSSIEQKKAQMNDFMMQREGLSDEAEKEMILQFKELEKQLTETQEQLNKELAENRLSINQQSKLEDSLNGLDFSLDELKINIKKSSEPTNSQSKVEENLIKLESLEKDIDATEDMINSILKLREEATPNLSKSELIKFDKKIDEMQTITNNLKNKILESKNSFEKELNKWNLFKENKKSITENLENLSSELKESHKIRKGLHGGDIDDKASLLNENKFRIECLMEREKEIEDLLVLAKDLNSEIPMKEVIELKDLCQEEKKNLELEITRNKKDLDDHNHFQDELNSFHDWLKETDALNNEIQETPDTKDGLIKKQKLIERLDALKSPGNDKLKELRNLQKDVINVTAPIYKDQITLDFNKEAERFNTIFMDIDTVNDDINNTLLKLEILDDQCEEITKNIKNIHKDFEMSLNQPRDSIAEKDKLEKDLTRYNRLIDQKINEISNIQKESEGLKGHAYADVLLKLKNTERNLVDMKKEIENELSRNNSLIEQQLKLEDKLNNLDSFINKFEDNIAECSVPADNERIIEENMKKIERLKSQLPIAKTLLEEIISSRNQFNLPEQCLKSCEYSEQKFFDVEDEIVNLEKSLEMSKNNWRAFNSEKEDLENWIDSINLQMLKLNENNQGIHGGKLEEKEMVLDAHKNLLQDVINHEAEINDLIDRSTPLVMSPNNDSPNKVTNSLCKKYEKTLETLTNIVQENQIDLEIHEMFESEVDKFGSENNRLIKELNDEISNQPNNKIGLLKKAELYDEIRKTYNQRAKLLPDLEKIKENLIEHSSSKAIPNIEQLWDKIIDNFEKAFAKTNDNQSKLLATVNILEKTESNCDATEKRLNNIEKQREECLIVPVSTSDDNDAKLNTLKDLCYELNDLQSTLDQLNRKTNELPMLQEKIEKVKKQHKLIHDNINQDISQCENTKKDLQNFSTSLKNLKTWLDHNRSQFDEQWEIDNVDTNSLKQKHTKLKILQDDIAGHKVDLSRLQTQLESLVETTHEKSLKSSVEELSEEYKELHDQCQTSADKYDNLIKLMNKYEYSRSSVLHWIDANTQVLLKCSDYSVNDSQVRSKLIMIENLKKDLEWTGQPKFIEAIQNGEDLINDLIGMGRSVIERQIKDLNLDWAEMCRQINHLLNTLITITSRADSFKETIKYLSSWLDDIEHAGMLDSSVIDHNCQRPLENKNQNAQYERVKTLLSEVDRHKPDFEQLHTLSSEMANPAFDLENSQIQTRFNKLQHQLKDKIDSIEKQEAKLEKVKRDIENAEKWIFHTSMQIINENTEQNNSNTTKDGDITAVIEQSNEIFQSVEDKESEILRIHQDAISLMTSFPDQTSNTHEELKEDLMKMDSNFNNLKTTALNKKINLLGSIDKWTNYKRVQESAKLFLENDVERWWQDQELSPKNLSYSTKDKENKLREITDLEQKIVAVKKNVEEAANQCNGIPSKISTALARSQTPTFQSYKVSTLQSPILRSSSATPYGMVSTRKNSLNLEPTEMKTIFEQLDDNLANLSAKKKAIHDKYTDWNNFNREKSAFKNWFDNEIMKFQSTLQSSPKTTSIDTFQRKKLKNIQDEMRSKKPVLMNLVNRFDELTGGKPCDIDPLLNEINQEFYGIEKEIMTLLNREDKEVEADFTEDDSKADIIQEVFIPKLSLNIDRCPYSNSYKSPDSLSRFTQTFLPKNETTNKNRMSANFSCQTPRTKKTQTIFDDSDNNTFEYSRPSSRNSKKEQLFNISNKINEIRTELDKTKFTSDRGSSPSSLSSRRLRAPNQESVRKNMISSSSINSPHFKEMIVEENLNGRPQYQTNSMIEASFQSTLNNQNINDYVPTKDKWHDLELFLQSKPQISERFQRPTPSREFLVAYKPATGRSKSKSNRSNIYNDLKRLTKDSQDLRSMDDELRN